MIEGGQGFARGTHKGAGTQERGIGPGEEGVPMLRLQGEAGVRQVQGMNEACIRQSSEQRLGKNKRPRDGREWRVVRVLRTPRTGEGSW